MPPEPGSAPDWLRFARSDLGIAQGPPAPGVLREMLCFHAQQAVEKSVTAVLLAHGIAFPRAHNLRILFDLLPPMIPAPGEVEEAIGLSDYAATLRYPGEYEPVSEEDWQRAVRLAERVVLWAENALANASR